MCCRVLRSATIRSGGGGVEIRTLTLIESVLVSRVRVRRRRCNEGGRACCLVRGRQRARHRFGTVDLVRHVLRSLEAAKLETLWRAKTLQGNGLRFALASRSAGLDIGTNIAQDSGVPAPIAGSSSFSRDSQCPSIRSRLLSPSVRSATSRGTGSSRISSGATRVGGATPGTRRRPTTTTGPRRRKSAAESAGRRTPAGPSPVSTFLKPASRLA